MTVCQRNTEEYNKRDNISRAYIGMRCRYCGKLVSTPAAAMSIVTTTTLCGGELWGVHSRTAAQHHIAI